MSHKFETLLYAVFFTFWCVRLYYKLYEKTTKKYILNIGILIIIWMIIRITKSVVDNIFLERMMWYLYYIPLIFIPTLFYICCNSLNKNMNKKRKILLYTISSILLVLVLTNDFHQLVFKFPNGIYDYDVYKHYIVYYIISIWIFYLFGGGMLTLVIERIKLKKDFKAILPLIVLLIGIIYTILYVIDIFSIRNINMSVANSLLICLGIELAFYLDLIPNNSKYIKLFKNSSLDISIISLDGKITYKTKSFNTIPNFILNDIKHSKVKTKYTKNNIIYNIKKNNDSYVIIKKDITELSKLKEKNLIKNKQLLKQHKSIKLEEKTKKELYEINLRKNVITQIEKKLNEKRNDIKDILNKKNICDEDLEKIKRIIIFSKKKSQLMISELNKETFNNQDIKNILNELIVSMSSLNVKTLIILKNKMTISASAMSNIYDIIYELIENIKNKTMMVYISKEKNIIIKALINDKANFNEKKLNKNITVNKENLDTDTEFTFEINGGEI